jgi:hypothetical protein
LQLQNRTQAALLASRIFKNDPTGDSAVSGSVKTALSRHDPPATAAVAVRTEEIGNCRLCKPVNSICPRRGEALDNLQRIKLTFASVLALTDAATYSSPLKSAATWSLRSGSRFRACDQRLRDGFAWSLRFGHCTIRLPELRVARVGLTRAAWAKASGQSSPGGSAEPSASAPRHLSDRGRDKAPHAQQSKEKLVGCRKRVNLRAG